MTRVYKYNPEDYKNILNLSTDLKDFYSSLERYRENKTDDNWFNFKKKWESLFFTIKHREVEGFLSPVSASELREYLEELIYDWFQ